MRNLRSFRITYALALAAFLAFAGLATDAKAYEAKTSRANRVLVNVRPVKLAIGEEANFEVRMNTHSVELDEDMTAVSILKDDAGIKYRPVGWRGSPPGGHHRSGLLLFPALEGKPRSVTLIISGVSDVPERSFTWEIGR